MNLQAPIRLLRATACVALAGWLLHAAPAPSVERIIAQSIEATQSDWNAAPNFDYQERDTDPSTGDSKTYHVQMILGSPYNRLVAVNGKPLSLDKQQQEEKKLQEETRKRRNESLQEHSKRVADYEKSRKRDHALILEMPKALKFSLRGSDQLDGHAVYVINATPREGYSPPNSHAKVLTGMEGTLWIDQETYQWMKVEAHVVHTVSIAGFLADVQPGTFFLLEKRPVTGGVWQPSHFEMKAEVKILDLIPHDSATSETYFDYKKVR